MTSTNLTNVVAAKVNSMFFNPGSVAIAPIENDNSTSLVLYSNKSDDLLYV
jgi:hypothetical protein